MKLIFMLVFLVMLGCGGADTDPVLEEEVQQQFSREIPVDRYRFGEGYQRITDCFAVSWGMLMSKDNVFLIANVGNVCPYPIHYFAPTQNGAGNLALRFSTGAGLMRWCYWDMENLSRVWPQVQLQPGEVRSIGGPFSPKEIDALVDGHDAITIAWPRPGGAFFDRTCSEHDESSHIFKTYRVEFTAEELEYLSQRFK